MDKSEPVYRFKADKIPDSMKNDITSVRDYLYSVSESYINKILARAKDTQKNTKKIRVPKVIKTKKNLKSVCFI